MSDEMEEVDVSVRVQSTSARAFSAQRNNDEEEEAQFRPERLQLIPGRRKNYLLEKQGYLFRLTKKKLWSKSNLNTRTLATLFL